MDLDQKTVHLQQKRNSLEALLSKQSKKVMSVLHEQCETDFWEDRQQRNIQLILRAMAAFALFYLGFEIIGLPVNYYSTEPLFRIHDTYMTFIAYTAGWAILGSVYFAAKNKNLHQHYTIIVILTIIIGFATIQTAIFSSQTISMAWRGSILIVCAYMLSYFCSGIKNTHVFVSLLIASSITCVNLWFIQKDVIVWVMFNIMILGNLAGLGLSILVISTERLKFLQGLIIQIDHDINILLNAHLLQPSNQDTLTLLGNRRSFEQQLSVIFQKVKQEKSEFSILFIDVDYFKFYNDYYGHPQGDQALIQVAQILMKYIKIGDVATRYGGEEFVILLTETSEQHALQVADQILEDLRQQQIEHTASKVCKYLTVSIGITVYDGQLDLQQSDVLRTADMALYQAKNNGRNQRVILAPNEIQELNVEEEKMAIHSIFL